WLILLLLIPLTIWWSFRSLAGLGTTRRWIALGLRCSLLLFLTLALAEVYLLHTNDTTTVLFLWDRSVSIPREYDPRDTKETKVDLVKDRHINFIWNAVAQRGSKHLRDNAGLIIFGRNPRLELPPERVPTFGPRRITSTVDPNFTDISAALKLALACFPEGTGKRIVLISDGNENLGKAEEQARIAKQNGVEIDTVAVSTGDSNLNEILVERIDAPVTMEAGTRMPIRIVIRSYNPKPVIGKLWISKTSMKTRKAAKDPIGKFDVVYKEDDRIQEKYVRINLGLNVFYFRQPPVEEGESYTYKALFEYLGVEKTPVDLDNPNLAALDKSTVKLDRPENNFASTTVMSRGEKKLLLIEPVIGMHALLLKRLVQNKPSLKVVVITPEQLKAQGAEQLNFYLGSFDCIILANVPRDSFTPEQDAALRSCVHEQGCGLIMIGGVANKEGIGGSFGQGGWHNTEVEKALPVTCDIKSMEIEGKSGLVLIMHASEIAEGNMWQKKIAKLAIDKLSPMDMMGLLYYDWTGNGDHVWHIPFQQIGGNKAKMLGLVDGMNPGDMMDAEPSLKKAYDALTDPQHKLGTKHIIFISDGDHWQPPVALLRKIGQAKITLSTVCITSHGQGEYKRMKEMVEMTVVDPKAPRGTSYPKQNPDGTFTPLDPRELPQIYIKETRLISQSFVYEKKFVPSLFQATGPTDGLQRPLPPLHGFIRTTPRPGPLVQLPIMTPKIDNSLWPVLAYWQYGLGKGVAFTSDALTTPDNTSWDRDWANSEMYTKFWDQLVDWSMRNLDDGKHLQMTTEWRDGKLFIVVTARDDDKKPMTDLDIVVRVSSPDPKPGDAGRPDIKLEQKNVGRYEAEVKAEEIGSYFLTAMAYRNKQGKGPDGKLQVVREPVGMVQSSVNVPYSPEFSDLESNPSLLKRLSDITGGKFHVDDDDILAHLARRGDVFRISPNQTKSLQSIWYWLLVLTGVGLFFDVAVRRIAIDPAMLATVVQAEWEQLRGMRPAETKAPQFLDRLKTRKEQIGDSLEKQKATRRFEGTDAPVEAPPMAGGLGGEQRPPTRPASPPPRVAPEAEAKPADYASRLLQAKRKAMQDRDKDSPPK
ncbi:MAG TPA: VWA domain-containing protein, partial [Gemmataceae bacterium]|nr:VWA domain-containing protein [Gemmataceae bacterium]